MDKIINNKAMIQFHNDGGEYFDQINTGETLNTLFFVYWPDNEISNTTNDPNSSYSGIRFGSNNRALWLGDVSGSLSNELISFNGNGAAHMRWIPGKIVQGPFQIQSHN